MRSNVSWKRLRVSRSILRIASSSVVSASVRSANCRSRYSLRSDCSLSSSIAARLTCAEPLDPLGRLGEPSLPAGDGRVLRQRGRGLLEVEPRRGELLEQRFAPHAEFLHRESHALRAARAPRRRRLRRPPLLVELAQRASAASIGAARVAELLLDASTTLEAILQRRSQLQHRLLRPRRAAPRARCAASRAARSARRSRAEAREQRLVTGAPRLDADRDVARASRRLGALPVARGDATAAAVSLALDFQRAAPRVELGHRGRSLGRASRAVRAPALAAAELAVDLGELRAERG